MKEDSCTYITSFSKNYYNKIARHTLHTWELIKGHKLFIVDDYPAFRYKGAKIINGDAVYPRDKYYRMTVGKCQKFWRKGRAFMYAVETAQTRYVVWIDSDVKIFKPIDIEKLLPTDGELATVLVNDSKQIESGFVIIDTQHPDIKKFVFEYKDSWYNGTLKKLYKPWDGDVLLHVLKKYKFKNLRTVFIKKPQGFEKTILEEYMHHYSGKSQKELVRYNEK